MVYSQYLGVGLACTTLHLIPPWSVRLSYSISSSNFGWIGRDIEHNMPCSVKSADMFLLKILPSLLVYNSWVFRSFCRNNICKLSIRVCYAAAFFEMATHRSYRDAARTIIRGMLIVESWWYWKETNYVCCYYVFLLMLTGREPVMWRRKLFSECAGRACQRCYWSKCSWA